MHKPAPLPLLTSLTVVVRRYPCLETLAHVTHLINAFADGSVHWTLARAAEAQSLHAMRRVAHWQCLQWAALPSKLAQCHRLEAFSRAMIEVARSGFIKGAQWLHEEYCADADDVGYATEIAAQSGHADLLIWLWEAFPATSALSVSSLDPIIRNGHDGVLELLWSRMKHEIETLQESQVCNAGHDAPLHTVRFLAQHCINFNAVMQIEMALYRNRVDVIKWLHEQLGTPLKATLFHEAITTGSLVLVQYLHRSLGVVRAPITSEAINIAAAYGYLSLVEWLDEQKCESYVPRWSKNSDHTVDNVLNTTKGSSEGHFQVCQWLQARGCLIATEFVEIAMATSNLSMLQYLFEINPEIFAANVQSRIRINACHGKALCKWLAEKGVRLTGRQLHQAITGGDLDVVQWFHENHPHIFTPRAMDIAAGSGHLEIVKFMHEHRTEGCTTAAMDNAAAGNHLDVVRFLHDNRSEGCTTYAMDATTSFEVLEFLYRHREEGCSYIAFNHAARIGRIDLLAWHWAHFPQVLNIQFIMMLMRRRAPHISLWLEYVQEEMIRTLEAIKTT